MAFPRHLPGSSVEPSPSFPEIEHRVLAGWKEGNTFQKSIDQREGCDEWVFYDGPPFANGCPTMATCSPGMQKMCFPASSPCAEIRCIGDLAGTLTVSRQS
jgi:isoleucyl-tRNA synthetase